MAKKHAVVPEYTSTSGGKKKRFMVMKRTSEDVTIDVGRGKRKFWKDVGGKADVMYVDSASEAADIEAVYGRKGTNEVWVKEHGNMGHERTYKEGGVHSYFFGQPKENKWVWANVDGEVKQVLESVAVEYGLPIVNPRRQKAQKRVHMDKGNVKV